VAVRVVGNKLQEDLDTFGELSISVADLDKSTVNWLRRKILYLEALVYVPDVCEDEVYDLEYCNNNIYAYYKVKDISTEEALEEAKRLVKHIKTRGRSAEVCDAESGKVFIRVKLKPSDELVVKRTELDTID